MNCFADLTDVVTEREMLSAHTLFGLGGPARWFARPRSVEQVADLVHRCRENGVDLRVLGLGANLLVGDHGVDGLVLRLSDAFFRRVDWDAGGSADGLRQVRVGGGADMNRLARDAVRQGLAGLEVMAGIPGTLGGIVRMNAGGRFGQIADVIRDVTVIDTVGRVQRLTPEQVGFSYRHTELGDAMVVEATLDLRASDPAALRQRFLDIWHYKKESQPLADLSAGCVFKNPPGDSAGRLIDQAGFKGRSSGGAFVSTKHANFIVAKEGATARDVLSLIGTIRREVAERFGVELELEIEVWDRRLARQAEPIM